MSKKTSKELSEVVGKDLLDEETFNTIEYLANQVGVTISKIEEIK